MSYRLAAPNEMTSAGVLRDLVCALLCTAGLASLIDDARLCTSEVVTNVHRHTQSDQVIAEVSLGHERVTINVYDDAPRALPMPRETQLMETNGNGLTLVDRFSDGWGVTQFGGLLPTSKAVWFQFDLRRRGLLT
ncbi:ATP-binding protein [Streptomyces sp. LNU-CPARS28]|uniref:ATP-binding protein n=1 Tax=Streptomyces sp. LNU-CPARS28 TaxID=3137371 RepID=UPI00313484BC